MAWLYVPGLVGLNLDCPSSCPATAPSVMWRGKRMPPPLSHGAWKTVSSSPLLSTMTSDPSTVARGLDSWISSLRATRVSRSPALVLAEAKTTLDTYGRTSPESSESAVQLSLFAKTSPLICTSVSLTSSRIWNAWATALRRECSRRGLSERPTGGSVSSGSHVPTPLAQNGEHAGQASRVDGVRTVNPQDFALRFPTPTAQDYGTNKGGAAGRVGPERPSLATMARREVFPTPQAFDANPCVRSPEALARAKKIGGCSNLRETVPGGQLNPTWVEWLMGFPIGWTVSAPLGTELFRQWRRAHGACCSGG